MIYLVCASHWFMFVSQLSQMVVEFGFQWTNSFKFDGLNVSLGILMYQFLGDISSECETGVCQWFVWRDQLSYPYCLVCKCRRVFRNARNSDVFEWWNLWQWYKKSCRYSTVSCKLMSISTIKRQKQGCVWQAQKDALFSIPRTK